MRPPYLSSATTLLAVAAHVMPAAYAAAPLAVSVHAASAAPISAYAPAEFAVTLAGGSAPYANPFDPEEIAVDATCSGPGGRSLRIPAFWSAPYQRGPADPKTDAVGLKLARADAAGWRLRAAFPAAGVWRVTVTARDRSGSAASSALTVSVRRSADSGFVRRATGAGRKRYFQLDDGHPFFLVGENVCWAGSRRLADYDDWFPALAHAGGNYARLWMAYNPLESKESGLGHYNLENAAYFDNILALARQNGLRCMLAFDTYGDLASGGYFNEGAWGKNPYNVANGGPVASATPDAFFTDPTARKFYKRRLRYLIARYSAYTSVGFWEFWNEKAAPARWVSEMSDYLRANDPYRHLITNSYPATGAADVWSLPNVDLTQTHRYGDNGSLRDIAPGLPADTQMHDAFSKPHLVGEFGIAWQDSDAKWDPKSLGTNFHNGLWGGVFSGDAGGGALWWWDNYVAPKNLYGTFTGLAKFAKTVDWPRRAFEPLTLDLPTRPHDKTETFTDLVIPPVTGWGGKTAGPIRIARSGRLSGPGTAIATLFGPEKPEYRSVLTFDVDLPAASSLTLRVQLVSQRSNIRVAIDGKSAADFPFDARPVAAGATPNPAQDYASTKAMPQYNGIYQATFDKDRTVPLPAGKHRITLENTEGDWLSVSSYRFAAIKSSRFATVLPYALQDAATGETLIWLEDPESNWQNDRDGIAPKAQEGIELRVAFPHAGHYIAEWWDTRKGAVVSRVPVTVGASRSAALAVPAFTRDVAVRVTAYR